MDKNAINATLAFARMRIDTGGAQNKKRVLSAIVNLLFLLDENSVWSGNLNAIADALVGWNRRSPEAVFAHVVKRIVEDDELETPIDFVPQDASISQRDEKKQWHNLRAMVELIDSAIGKCD